MVRRHLRDVHQALDAVAYLHERPERHQLRDASVHQLPYPVAGREFLPGILLGGLERQADPLPVQVHLQHLHVDAVAGRHHRARVVDVLPGQLRHVDQAVHAAEVDECAEVDHRRHHTAADLPRPQVVEERLPLLALGLLQPRPAAQHHVVAVLVELDDLGLQLGAHVRLQVAHPAQLHQRGRHETPQADVDNQTTLDYLDHHALDRGVGLSLLLDPPPGPLVLGPLLGQDQPALLVLAGDDQGLDRLAQGDHVAGIDIVADAQLAGRYHALGLVADVEQDLFSVDADDRALYDLAVLDDHHGGVVGVVEADVAEVVLDDLARDVGAVLGEGAHVGGRGWLEDGGGGVGHGVFPGWVDGRMGPSEATGGALELSPRRWLRWLGQLSRRRWLRWLGQLSRRRWLRWLGQLSRRPVAAVARAVVPAAGRRDPLSPWPRPTCRPPGGQPPGAPAARTRPA